MMKTRVITFANQKGGSGKTTVALNIASILGERGFKVLVIDLDSQAHLSYWSGLNTYDKYPSIYDCLLDRCPLNKAIFTPNHKLYEIIPSSSNFNKNDLKQLLNFQNPENKLNKKILIYKKKYDFVLIDTPPTFAIMTLNALIASNYVIIPILLNFLSIEGLSQLVQNIYKINHNYNHNLKLLGIVPNQYNLRSNHAKKLLNEINENFEKEVIFPKLRNDIKLAEAPEHRMPINLYAKNSKANMDFNLITDYLIDIIK